MFLRSQLACCIYVCNIYCICIPVVEPGWSWQCHDTRYADVVSWHQSEKTFWSYEVRCPQPGPQLICLTAFTTWSGENHITLVGLGLCWTHPLNSPISIKAWRVWGQSDFAVCDCQNLPNPYGVGNAVHMAEPGVEFTGLRYPQAKCWVQTSLQDC